MKAEPVLTALPPPPMKDTKWATSGSLPMIALTCSCRAFIEGNDTSWGASLKPPSCPVSCWGNSPFGTMMNRNTVSPIIPKVTSSISTRWSSTQLSALP